MAISKELTKLYTLVDDIQAKMREQGKREQMGDPAAVAVLSNDARALRCQISDIIREQVVEAQRMECRAVLDAWNTDFDAIPNDRHYVEVLLEQPASGYRFVVPARNDTLANALYVDDHYDGCEFIAWRNPPEQGTLANIGKEK